MIYLDNAATTAQKPESVAEASMRVLASGQYGNPTRGAHEYSLNAFKVVYEGRELIKRLFNVPDASLVSFTNNATTALNTAIKGLLHTGDHVISTTLDHNSVLRPIYQLEKQGVAHDFIGLNERGQLDYQQFERVVKSNTKMLVCTHASNVTGELLDLTWLSKFCQAHQLIFVLDVAQTAGVVPIDMQEKHIDILCFTGHKSLFGPQGTGGICFAKQVEIEALLVGGSGIDSFSHEQPESLPERLEAGTLNVPGIAGLAAGVQYILEAGVANLGDRSRKLADCFLETVESTDAIKCYSSPAKPHVGTVAINIGDLDSAEVADILATDYGIATRPGAHCAPLVHNELGTVKQGIVRFSFSSFNTQDDVTQSLRAIEEIVRQL